MEIRVCLCFAIISCISVQYLDAKSVSLNEILAAESQGEKQAVKETRIADRRSKTHARIAFNENEPEESQSILLPTLALAKLKSLPNRVKHLSALRKLKDLLNPLSLSNRIASLRKLRPDNLLGDKLTSLLKYRKTFQIKSPLKPKKLKRESKFGLKRRNQSIKREISDHEGLTHKYIPLLKNLDMLFDNLIGTDDSNSIEYKPKKYKRYRFFSEEQTESPSSRSREYTSRITKPRSKKTTTTPSPSFFSETSSDTESLTLDEDHDDGTHRPNKIIPVLLPRNSISLQRDDNGPSERSSATHHGNIEGNISRINGTDENNTGYGQNESHAENDEIDTNSTPRSDTSGFRYSGRDGDGNNTTNSEDRQTEVFHQSKDESTNDTFGNDQFETGGNQTEGENSVREPVRRLREQSVSQEVTTTERDISQSIHPEEVREESVLSTTHDSAGHKRIIDKNGSFPAEDEKNGGRNETNQQHMIVIERNTRNRNSSKDVDKKMPVVLIFDGYSVTRDKNGENKVAGKTIHIRS